MRLEDLLISIRRAECRVDLAELDSHLSRPLQLPLLERTPFLIYRPDYNSLSRQNIESLEWWRPDRLLNVRSLEASPSDARLVATLRRPSERCLPTRQTWPTLRRTFHHARTRILIR